MSGSIQGELRNFADNTSAHGVRLIFHGHHVAVKVAFLIFWVSAVTFCVFRASLSIRKYCQQETTSRYEMFPASPTAVMDFPTITACNLNMIRKSYLKANPGLMHFWKLASIHNFQALAELDWESEELSPYQNLTYYELLKEAQMYNDTFISCTQGRMRYCVDTVMGADYYQRDIEFVSGSCFRINPYGTLKGKSGDYGVLTMMLLADRDEYIYNSSNVGWVMAIHESERYGASIDNGIKISPGYTYFVNLDMMNIKNHRKHCEKSVNMISGYGRYDQTTCLLDCRDRQLYEKCGCLMTVPPNAKQAGLNYLPCTLKQVSQCALRTYVKYVKNYADVRAKSTTADCDCFVTACSYTLYTTSVTATPIPDLELQFKVDSWKNQARFSRFRNYTYEDLGKNMAVIEVYFGTSSITSIEEVVAYDFDNLLGDIGGVMGLFLGASMFTAMEFVTLIISLSLRIWRTHFPTKDSSQDHMIPHHSLKLPRASVSEVNL